MLSVPLVREAQPIVEAASRGDLSSVGLEEGGIANQVGAGDSPAVQDLRRRLYLTGKAAQATGMRPEEVE